MCHACFISSLLALIFQLKFSRMSEDILHHQNNKNSDEKTSSSTLKRAMTVTKIDQMLQCINDLKLCANTVEKDLFDYFETIGVHSKNEMHFTEIHCEDLIEQAQQRSNDDRYILLRDFIKPNKVQSITEISRTISFSSRNSISVNPNFCRQINRHLINKSNT